VIWQILIKTWGNVRLEYYYFSEFPRGFGKIQNEHNILLRAVGRATFSMPKDDNDEGRFITKKIIKEQTNMLLLEGLR